MDAATDAEIARMLAEDQGYYYEEFGGGVGGCESDGDPDYGAAKKKKSKKTASKKAQAASASAPKPTAETCQPGAAGDAPEDDDGAPGDELTATGRRKRKDTGGQRTTSRSWTEDEEKLFLEALALHGRDWKKGAEHIGTRDHRAIASHAQKFLIKALMRGEELPGKMGESGRGYTLSGKPLDPNSAAARAYGLRADAFQRVVDSGFLQEGIHVTTLSLNEDALPPKREPKAAATAATAKRPRKQSARSPDPGSSSAPGAAGGNGYNGAGSSGDDAFAFTAAEPTEYAKNRPRRQVASAKAHLGDTTESLDLTTPANFVGPPGSGAPLSQPFAVTVAPEALLVMDFHAHLSCCEIIGLLGGTFDPEGKKLSITAAYPCRRAAGSDSSTSVELDAESQVEVTCEMDERGLIPVGWYHSHPVFEPRPSVKDNENQRNYQALCRDVSTGLEPWVGAIVGPFDQSLPTPASQMQLWVVRQQGKDLVPYNVRATKTPPVEFPGEAVEGQLAIALEQLKDDAARTNVLDTWRSCTRFIQGHPEGPPIIIADKIKAALRAHLPRNNPEKEEGFFSRLEGHFKDHWGVELPPEASPPRPEPLNAGAGDGAVAELPVAMPAEPQMHMTATTEQLPSFKNEDLKIEEKGGPEEKLASVLDMEAPNAHTVVAAPRSLLVSSADESGRGEQVDPNVLAPPNMPSQSPKPAAAAAAAAAGGGGAPLNVNP